MDIGGRPAPRQEEGRAAPPCADAGRAGPSSPGRGSARLPEPRRLLSALPARARARIRTLEVRDSVASTNDLLHEALPESGQRVRLARAQTRGRGRQGRVWVGAADALCLSVLHAHAAPPSPALSLRVGVAVAARLHREGFAAVQLSWPNDLVAGAAKLGGILLEQRARAARCWSVAGLGLNLDSVPATDRPATSLHRACRRRPDRERLAVALIDAVSDALARPDAAGEPLPAASARHDALRDRTVRVVGSRETCTGVARGVDAAGRLLVDGDAGRRAFCAADVRLHRP